MFFSSYPASHDVQTTFSYQHTIHLLYVKDGLRGQEFGRDTPYARTSLAGPGNEERNVLQKAGLEQMEIALGKGARRHSRVIKAPDSPVFRLDLRVDALGSIIMCARGYRKKGTYSI